MINLIRRITVIILAVNITLVMAGVGLPYIISSDKMPLYGIVILITSILGGVAFFVCYGTEKIYKNYLRKKYRKYDNLWAHLLLTDIDTLAKVQLSPDSPMYIFQQNLINHAKKFREIIEEVQQ
jgi:hypothetical protein